MFIRTILIILVCPCCILCETYYVTPTSSNVTCPFESCLTLSQVAALFNESDIALTFLPGNHSIDTPLLVENGNSFRMDELGNSSDVVKIECKHPKSFNINVRNVSDMHISGLKFVGCTSSLHLVEQVWITGCQFSHSKKTALTFVESTVYIANSSFRYNEGGSYQLDLKNLVGGALFARNSKVTVLNSFFQRNSAESGGAIYCHSNQSSHFILFNSNFIENTAKCYGGVLYSNGCKVSINNSTFQNNSAVEAVEAGRHNMQNRGTRPSHHDHGGVLALFKSSVSIHRSAFTQNRAKNEGGVIFMEKSNIVSDENNFYQNNAQQGGVIRGYWSNFNDKQSNFSENKASDETGVLYCHQKCVVTFIKSVVSLNNATKGKIIDIVNGKISIVNSTVMRNFAAAVTGTNIQIKIINSEFTNNIAYGFHTTTLDLFQASQVVIMESNFTNNTIYGGQGAVLRLESDHFVKTVVIINGSRFSNNAAYRNGNGGVISYNTHKMNIVLVDSTFESNVAVGKGGVLYNEKISPASINIINCTFHNNSANDGGVLYAHSIQISISKSEFKTNSAFVGGAVMFLSEKSTVEMKDVVINGNAASRGVIYLMECTVILSGNLSFSDNLGSLLAYGSTINITDYVKFNNSSQKSNTALQEGGAVTAFQSEIICYGKCTFSNNSAEYGGAILATESKLQFYGEIEIVGNRAANSGGGIYLQQSEILCNNSNITLVNNTAVNGGGGVYAVGSTIRLDFPFINNLLETSSYYYTGSQLAFLMNKANKGGGLYLESNAKLYIQMKVTNSISPFDKLAQNFPLVQHIHALTFEANKAVYGGAVYVADNTNFATCTSILNKQTSTTSTNAECFFQLLLLNNVTLTVEMVYYKSFLIFEKNVATLSGATLYGGLLDRCTVSPFANIFGKEKDTLTFIMDSNGTDISSAPVRICFCRNNQPDCSSQPPPIKIGKGEKFTITVAAVDQASQTVKNATIRSSLLSKFGGLGENQLSQITNGSCADLHYEIFSPNTSETLIMYADGPCKDALPSQGRLDIHFYPCSCPVGFQQSLNPSEATRCTCECDPQLNGYITDCHPQTGDLVRKGNYWIAYLNTSTKNHYLAYPNCPLDYCLPASSRVIFNLKAQDGTDAQCTNDHSGKLCGPCKPGLSLSIGSSRCIPCPNYWPAMLVTILIAALIGGVLLIAVILIFNLTVAVGSLNGIIFYANIVYANANIFLPFRKTNFITVFIAWLNLELGFDTCFFDGMDAFWKTLFQLAFPMYLITLLVVIIVVSERYAWFARLFEKKNPVATLATLVLLSYVKLLHAIIASFSFIILKYPDGSKETVWLPDATVGYFRGRHICLFLTASLVLLGGIAYTVLLFSWQWLLHCKHKTLTKIITYHRLYMFLDPYHAPYNYEYRYWTGLLLLVRAVLYTVAAVNVSNDPEVNLLAVAIAMTGLLLLKGFANKSIYKKWPLDVLEVSCYINILCFCLAMLFALAGNRDGTTIAFTSGSLIVFKFAAVLCIELLSKPAMRLWSKCKQRMQHTEILCEAELKKGHQFEITYSEVPAPSHEEVPYSQNQCKEESADNTVSYHQMTK